MGRYLFGAAALALGVASLALHSQLVSNWTLPGSIVFLYATALAQIAGGIAIVFPRSARLGAIILLAVYALFACTFVPEIFAQPRVYASYGDVFYSLALVVGALLAYALASPSASTVKGLENAALIAFGLCNISYAIEQVEFFARTASLVPSWVPFGGSFWSIATTIAFALGGLSLLIRYKALLASQLLAAMLLIFGVTIWIPMLIAQPNQLGNWSEGIETFAIAGAAWIVADFLAGANAVARATRNRQA
jgi:drug/metabolite transporter superfamily protein YnfA